MRTERSSERLGLGQLDFVLFGAALTPLLLTVVLLLVT